jgi:predicted O-linked N-acetylglucosamine transferase (SPINDLY family)
MSDDALAAAMQLRRAGKRAEAAAIYENILSARPHDFEALQGLGILHYQNGRWDEAARLMGEAARARPEAADASYNYACALRRLNRPEDALAAFDAAIAARPAYLEALANRGSVLMEMRRHADALAAFDAALALKADLAELWNNRGGALAALGRAAEALASYDRAVALKPDYADAWKNRGMAQAGQNLTEDALASFTKALALKPDDPDLVMYRADLLLRLGRNAEAAAAYEIYLAQRPDNADSWNRLGAALRGLRRLHEAVSAFDRALLLAPDYFAAHENRANVLYELERFEEAAADYQALTEAGGAEPYVTGYRTLARLHCCDWRGLEKERAKIADYLRDGVYVLDPTGNAVLSSAPEEQRRCAEIWVGRHCPPQPPVWQGERYAHDKIRVAYLSADFRNHATAFLMAGVFEHHDKTRFETTALSFGADDKSPMRARLMAGFDRFTDISRDSDEAAAALLRRLEIDIVVDLKGYTAEGRPGILSRRPAPVQAAYLGFPGTMAAPYVDYVIADEIVIPQEQRAFYSEKIAYLPDSYQCNDRDRVVASRTQSRAEAGLPDSGFVFCCFNNNHKILPETFDIWMRLLADAEGSVLWLLQDNDAAARHLRREAQARGIAPERLVFAPRVAPPDHLARHRLADLFLDTLPYNAHTTASDALWAGLPVLTVASSTFAGRVAASLVTALEMPELIAPTLVDYEAAALGLARAPERLAELKAKLARNREHAALFDTARFTHHLEAAYRTMWERAERGLPPATFAVPPRPRE